MKICINQYAFIATILCATTALYPNHHQDHNQPKDPSVETLRLLQDKAQMIESELHSLVGHYRTVKAQHDQASKYNYKDKSLSAKQHHKTRSLQGHAQKALDDINSKIHSIQSFLEKTIDQIQKTSSTAQSNTTKTMTHLSELSDLHQ